MKKYEYFDHTADVGIFAYGKDTAELFRNAALATTGQMVEIKGVKPKVERKISLKSDNLEGLLFDFLGELIYLKDADNLLFSKYGISVKKVEKGYKLSGTLKGDRINKDAMELLNDVKAVTMHMFKVEKTKGGYKATIILDI
ncbi:archease [Candidatus Woesearchaeota archaeon]|nr:archease [Candidatus Woesearchaeota archaeon]